MLLPPDPPLEPLHTRDYLVKAFRKGPDQILLRGAVRDVKPGELFIADDTEPMTMHHMLVDLTVAFPSLEILEVDVHFEAHPQQQCPLIIDHYDELVGLSVARGFTHKVRELFGGPRGCTHTTALLQAMAPVAVQCGLSMRSASLRGDPANLRPRQLTAEERKAHIVPMINTCHAWAEDGELVEWVSTGSRPALPIPIAKRLVELGRDPGTWGAPTDDARDLTTP